MRRHRSRPYGLAPRPTRIVGLLMALGVLWLLYDRFRDPATWKVLFDLKDDAVVNAQVGEQAPAPAAAAPVAEVIEPGPNDTDEEEVADAAASFELVADRAPLKPREMHAYWRLMGWTRTEEFATQNRRALHDVAFTQLWEQPERYRGKLISLRLHVRRVLKYDAPENPHGFKEIYEAWGWTDESRSFPYVVVFPECPEGLPVGTDIRGEVVFVGYFLKVMSYTAFDTPRGAPLLVGRVRVQPSLLPPPPAPVDPMVYVWIILGGTLFCGLFVWLHLRKRRIIRNRSLPVNDSAESQPDLLNLSSPESGRGPDGNIIDSPFAELEAIGPSHR